MSSTVEPRGSWNFVEGIVAQWRAEKLDEHFKTLWPADQRENYLALSDTERRGAGPMPYCVFSMFPQNPIRSTGGVVVDQQIVTYNNTLQFKLHGDSGKEQLVEIAKKIVAAFGPSVLLNFNPDKHVQTWQNNDFGGKEDDRHWFWLIEFTMQTEGVYRLPDRG